MTLTAKLGASKLPVQTLAATECLLQPGCLQKSSDRGPAGHCQSPSRTEADKNETVVSQVQNLPLPYQRLSQVYISTGHGGRGQLQDSGNQHHWLEVCLLATTHGNSEFATNPDLRRQAFLLTAAA